MGKFNYYNQIASIYDRTRWMTESVAEEVADAIVALVGATPETTFLEPGVGTGLNILPLVRQGYRVTGIDVSVEMLDQLRQKFNSVPPNLTLLHADASKLPFPEGSFDVVLTVHMVHTVSNWQAFLDEITRVLTPHGFYLNAQWITPPARMEFERHFRTILDKYKDSAEIAANVAIEKIDVETYFRNKQYQSNYLIAKEWTISNTVEKLLQNFRARAYGFCWQVSDELFERAIEEFERFCMEHYGSLTAELSSNAKFEIWTYFAS